MRSSRQGFSMMSISVPSRPSSPILPTPSGHKPESGPVPLLLGELAPADPVAVAMLEFAPRADGPAGVPVAVLLRAQDQIALAVEIGILLDPEPVPALPVAEHLPLGLIHGVALKLVAPGKLPASCPRRAAGGTPDPRPVRPGRSATAATNKQRGPTTPSQSGGITKCSYTLLSTSRCCDIRQLRLAESWFVGSPEVPR